MSVVRLVRVTVTFILSNNVKMFIVVFLTKFRISSYIPK
jgi:hypothetical protein